MAAFEYPAGEHEIIPASQVWVAPGGAAQAGTIILGMKLATGEDAAIAMTLDKAEEVLRLIRNEVDQIRYGKKGNAPFPVLPRFPQKL